MESAAAARYVGAPLHASESALWSRSIRANRKAARKELGLNPASDLVNRLWRLCTLLRKDGISYQQYVTELSYLLFLKMVHELGQDDTLPESATWRALTEAAAPEKLRRYEELLTTLGGPKADPNVRSIFSGAFTQIRDSDNLTKLIESIDHIGWFSQSGDSFGDLYEGILERNAEETKRGAGQYFTPRVLVEVVVDLLRPSTGEVVQDPAAGTGGFLIAADRYSRQGTGRCRITGMENVPGTHRLLLMNLFLHGIEGADVRLGDTLGDDGRALPAADLILTNPPFGPAGGRPSRTDLDITGTVSSFALPFVEHCARALKPGGRAAIVVPDSVLYEEGRGKALRTHLLDRFDVHTILRLPSGIFYAQSVKTNVLFLNRREDGAGTRHVWFYDLRTDMPAFSKSIPLSASHFDQFALFYGGEADGSDRPNGKGPADPRARRYDRQEIRDIDDNLDLTWLREDEGADGPSEPEELIATVQGYLSQAMDEVRALAEELDRSRADDRTADLV